MHFWMEIIGKIQENHPKLSPQSEPAPGVDEPHRFLIPNDKKGKIAPEI